MPSGRRASIYLPEQAIRLQKNNEVTKHLNYCAGRGRCSKLDIDNG